MVESLELKARHSSPSTDSAQRPSVSSFDPTGSSQLVAGRPNEVFQKLRDKNTKDHTVSALTEDHKAVDAFSAFLLIQEHDCKKKQRSKTRSPTAATREESKDRAKPIEDNTHKEQGFHRR